MKQQGPKLLFIQIDQEKANNLESQHKQEGMLETDSQPLEARREADTSFFLTALRRNRLYLYLDLEFLNFNTVRRCIFVVYANRFMEVC